MNIDGMGVETIDLLWRANKLNNIGDIYRLSFEDVIDLERMAEKSVNNLLEGVQVSKSKPFEKVLFALGIRFVGETVAKKLARAFGNIEKLMSATFEELVEVDEIGDRIAESVMNYFGNPTNVQLVNDLKEDGLNFEIEVKEVSGTSILEGKSFVVSGVFEVYSRNQIKELIEQNGGKNVGSISSKTSYVLAGDKMGPSKLKKAEALEIPILSEQEFIEMIS